MPNWVWTSMTITGQKEDLEEFQQKASQSFTAYYKGAVVERVDGTKYFDAEIAKTELIEKVISFMNFVTPVDLDAYYGASDYKPQGYDAMSTEERMAYSMQFASDGWYDWNVRNWGTKWDTHNPEIVNNDLSSGSLVYRFDTAWSPAEGAFRAMVSQHPQLLFDFYNEEEQGWGVEFRGKNGELSVVREWDIPND